MKKKIILKIFNKIISINVDEEDIIEDLANTFSYFLTDENQEKIDIRISAEEISKDQFVIRFNEYKSACTRTNLYPKLTEIVRRSLIYNCDLFCFHAAAVQKNGKSYIFIASGNSGKSTLCTALVFNGYKLLNDDTCWIDLNSGIIYPYPLAIGTRHKTLELFPTLKNLTLDTTFTGKLLLPIDKSWASQSTKIYSIFLWNLDFSCSEIEIEKLDKEETALTILSHSFSFKYNNNKKEQLRKLNSLLEKCFCYNLKGHNLVKLAEMLKNI